MRVWGNVAEVVDRLVVVWCVVGLLMALSCSFVVKSSLGCGIGSLLALPLTFVLLLPWCAVPRRHFPLKIFVASCIVYLIIVVAFNKPQESDFLLWIETAREYLAGNAQAFHIEYFQRWPDSLGYALLEVLLLSIWDNVFIIKFVEVLFAAGIVVIAFSCMKCIASVQTAQLLACILALFPTLAFANCSASNQVVSAFFSLMAVRAFMALVSESDLTKRFSLAFVSGCLVGFARFVRPDSTLVIIGLVGALCLCWSRRSREEATRSSSDRSTTTFVFLALIALLGFAIVVSALAFSVSTSGVASAVEPDNSVTVDKLVIGTDPETSGGWSATFRDQIKQEMERGSVSYEEAGLRLVAHRLFDVEVASNLIIGKTEKLWWGDSLAFALGGFPSRLTTWIYNIDKVVVVFLCVSNIFALLRYGRMKPGEKKSRCRVMLLIVALTMAAYLLIEVQGRYMYFAYIIMFILAAFGIDDWVQKGTLSWCGEKGCQIWRRFASR